MIEATASDTTLVFTPVLGEDGVARLHLMGLGGLAEDDPDCVPMIMWAEWSGMELDDSFPSASYAAEIVAGCLHEMTLLGVNEQEVLLNRYHVRLVTRKMENGWRRRKLFWMRDLYRRVSGGLA